MGNTIDTEKHLSETRRMFGRRLIKTSVREITADNVCEVLAQAKTTHDLNRSEIDYLWRYYKGDQPILHRVKEVRPEICNRVVENRAHEIVTFNVGYLCGEPIQYVGKTGEDSVTAGITLLNDMMFAEDKASQDQELVEWQMICGTSYRLVLPDVQQEDDDSPFKIYTLDPRDTFIVYSTDIGNRPLMGVKYFIDEQSITHFSVYTDSMYYQIDEGILTEATPHVLGEVPIFEYPANNARLGAFEIVLPLLDTLNNIISNRMDGTEQVVQAFIKFINCDISLEDYKTFLEMGAIKVKSTDGAAADVDIVTQELSQTQTQTLKDDVYNAILTICGIPNRNAEASSTSDTGAAILLRNGWSLAESRAKSSENMFKRAEKKMLKLVLRICSEYLPEIADLRLKDIELQFTRRNYENIQSKSQVLTTMLAQPKIHPLLAFQHCGMFVDPERAYVMSKEYYDEQMETWEPIEVDEYDEEEEDVPENGHVPSGIETSYQPGV